MASAQQQPSKSVASALHAWAGATSLDQARACLRDRHGGMSQAEKRELEIWTARLSFETLIEVLSLAEGVDEERVEWQGGHYHPRQLERLASWTRDQIATAAALGVAAEAWSKVVLAGAEWYRDVTRSANRAGPAESRIAAARKFLGG